MIFILYESADNTVCSVMSTFYEKYPVSCRGYISKQDTVENVNRYSSPPLLRGGWMLICDHRVSNPVLGALSKKCEHSAIILRVTNPRDKDSLFTRLDLNGIKYNFLDNFKLSKEQVVRYITSELNISQPNASLLYDRVKGYLPDIVGHVRLLSNFNVVERKEIMKYVSKSNRLGIYELLDHLLGVSDRSVPYTDVVKLLYDYRYAVDYLKKYLKDELEIRIKIFEFMIAGELGLENIKWFIQNNRSNSISKLSEFKIRKIIEDYSKVSIEWIYYLLAQINDLSHDKYQIYKIVLLCKTNS